MTEATRECQAGNIRGHRKSRYMQRTIRFQFRPLSTVDRNVEAPDVPDKNKVGLNAMPWNENKQKGCPFTKPVLEVFVILKMLTPN